MKQPVRHPSTERLFRAAWVRCLKLRKLHEQMSQAAWVGVLVQHFTDDELLLIEDQIPQLYRQRLRLAGRKVKWTKGENPFDK